MIIIGEYPCCDGPLLIEPPEEWPLPTIVLALCEHCGARVVHRFSRIDPMSWTVDDFPHWPELRDANGEPVDPETAIFEDIFES